MGGRIPRDEETRVNLKGRDLEDDEASCPILGLGFLLWTVRGFVRAEDSMYLLWSPTVPQKYPRTNCRRGLCRGLLKFVTNRA